MGFRKKSKSPPVLSHEFVIQNHADMVSCVAMVILLGLMFEITAKYAITFITVQYNVTQTQDARGEPEMLYTSGPKDLATVFFYMLIAMILHALVQEYVLDKMNRRLHLSKTKHSKFNESGQLAVFYLCSLLWGASILTGEEYVTNPTLLWEGYPHNLMTFQGKFFYVCQIAYWLHALPELYFQKVRKEDIPRQLNYVCLYGFHIAGAYILNLHRLGLILLVPHYLVELMFHASRLFYFSDENKQKGFTLWALLFVIARLLTLTLSVLTFGFGLSRSHNQGLSLTDGNFNILTVRISCLAAVCLTQAWMMWKFINFQLKKWREQSQGQTAKARVVSPRGRAARKDSVRAGGAANGVTKPDDVISPRLRKSKAS